MPPEPAPHTEAEIARLLGLVRELGADAVTVGHGRHPTSRAAAMAFVEVWADGGGEIVHVLDWPAAAASWLRPARRLTAGGPDAWVIADTPAGWARMADRLALSTDWDAARTIGFASLDDADLVRLGGRAVNGLSGATATGGTWRIAGGLLVRDVKHC